MTAIGTSAISPPDELCSPSLASPYARRLSSARASSEPRLCAASCLVLSRPFPPPFAAAEPRRLQQHAQPPDEQLLPAPVAAVPVAQSQQSWLPLARELLLPFSPSRAFGAPFPFAGPFVDRPVVAAADERLEAEEVYCLHGAWTFAGGAGRCLLIAVVAVIAGVCSRRDAGQTMRAVAQSGEVEGPVERCWSAEGVRLGWSRARRVG